MSEITAQNFWNEFVCIVKKKEEDKEEKNRVTYNYTKKWTAYIMNLLDELLQNEFKFVDIKNNDKRTNREYFRIDLVGWEKCKNSKWENAAKKTTEDAGLNFHFWDLDIAIEHENNSKDWSYEVIKLCHIKCGLKVVIGYSLYEKIEGGREEQDLKKLELVSENMKKLKYGSPKKEDAFLVILGNYGKYKSGYKSLNDIDYKAYSYNSSKKKFETISRAGEWD